MKKRRESKKKKDIIEVVIYCISMVLILIVHYFLISKININSTFQVFIDFVLFTFVMGFSAIIYESIKKNKNSKKRKK